MRYSLPYGLRSLRGNGHESFSGDAGGRILYFHGDPADGSSRADRQGPLARNLSDDVKTIQQALNRVALKGEPGGPVPLLAVDGIPKQIDDEVVDALQAEADAFFDAGLIPAAVDIASMLLTSLSTWPSPGLPTWKTFSQNALSTGSMRSKSAGSAPTIVLRRPSSASFGVRASGASM